MRGLDRHSRQRLQLVQAPAHNNHTTVTGGKSAEVISTYIIVDAKGTQA
jgi:hypothetical protein